MEPRLTVRERSGRRARPSPPLRLFTYALLASALVACGNGEGGGGDVGAGAAAAPAYEVWIVDQSDSDQVGRYGGTLFIFDGGRVEEEGSGELFPSQVVDLGGSVTTLCRIRTESNPVRPHMLLFNRAGTHAVLSFVASGHVVILDAATREPVACFRTSPGAGAARQAHAAFPSPNGRYIVVANQNGKLLERIDTDYESGSFTYNDQATLDLVQGMTPAGLPRESPELRPDNAPICPVIDASGRYVWVTLRGGGLFVVDATETPMRIVAEYDRTVVAGNGCGGVEAGGAMYLNSGGAPVNLQGEPHPFLHLHRFDVYRFPLEGYGLSQPNFPAPEVVFSAEGERDSHGMVAVRNEAYLWVVDRHQNLIEVLEVATGAHIGTIPLANELSEDPAPDLIDLAPSGELAFVSLRGAVPLTGDPHNATGSTPGLGVVRVDPDGRGGELIQVSQFSNIVAFEDVADPHGVRVRVLR